MSNLHLDATQSREEFGPDVGPVKLKLGGSEIQFDNGMWIAGNVDFSILLLPLGKIKRAFGILSSLLKKKLKFASWQQMHVQNATILLLLL